MNQVPHLKALSLRILVDSVWKALEERIEDNKHSLEINWNMEFLPIGNSKKEAPLFSTAFIADSKIGLTQHTNFYANKMKLDLILQYFNIPNNLKLDVAHMMRKHYKSANIFHKVFTIEMGFDFFHIQGYLHSPSYTFTLIDMLSRLGKRKIRKLFSENCRHSDIYPYWKINSMVQIEKCVTSFKNLMEFIDLSKCTTDSTLKLLSENCPFLKKLNIPCCAVSDKGLSHLYSSNSVTSGLYEINLCGTPVTPEGIKIALKSLPELRKLECSTIKASTQLFFSLIEEKLTFSKMKWLRCYITKSTLEQFDGLANLFPNLEFVVFYFTRIVGKINLQFLRLMQNLTDINLVCLETAEHESRQLFICKQKISYQMKSVNKLSLDNFFDVCLVTVFKIWPNLKYISMKNLFCCSCYHKKCSDKFAHNLRHMVLENSTIPKHYYMKLLTTVQTLAFSGAENVRFVHQLSIFCQLTHISLDCMETSFDAAFGKWLIKHCKLLKSLNLVEQEPNTDAIKWFMFQQPNVKITFHKIQYKHKWFEDDVFTPCTLCQYH